jgi:hypothetical protein
MLVTFKCSAYADITMFGNVAKKMLEMMGFGSQVPGAIRVEDVPRALENLRRGLAAVPDQPEPAGDEDDDGDEPAIGLHTRALPLLELLQAAIADESRVRWE